MAVGIGAAAELLGVADHVLRHWEDEGILRPARDSVGRRRYTEADLTLARGIRAGQAAGLSLAQIREFLRGGREHREALLRAHRDQLSRQRAQLEASAATVDSALHSPVDPSCPFGGPLAGSHVR